MTAACAIAVSTVLLGACARFDDAESAPFSPAPELGSAFDAGPRTPGPGQSGPPPMSSAPPPSSSPSPQPEECVDPDPAVIATCLGPTVAVVGLPTEAKAIVAEQDTGRLQIVSDSEPPVEFARISPEAGTVVGLALSPSYAQDKLVYAVLVRDGATRVARIAAGDTEKIVGDNLPASPNGAAGIAFVDDTLTIGVGTDILRFPDFDGVGTVGRSETVASLSDPVTGLCTPPTATPGLFATTSAPAGAALQQIDNGAVVRMWAWNDVPLATGCAVTPGGVAVALPDAHRVDLLGVDPTAGIAVGSPQPLAEDQYGRIAGVGLMASNAIVGTTINTDGGQPVPTDDRAIILPIAGSSADERT